MSMTSTLERGPKTTSEKKRLDFTMIPGSATIKGLTFTVEVITPKLAKSYLDAMMEYQRSEKPQKQKQYGGDMTAGVWHLGISAILIDWYGTVIDGNNRFKACVKAGVPFETVVIRGIKPIAKPAIDTGKPRSFADVCKMLGIADPVVVSAITKRVYWWENSTYVSHKASHPSHEQLVDTLERNHQIIGPAAARGRDVKAQLTQISPTVAGFAWLRFTLLNPDSAHVFIEKLASGAEMAANNPILVIRNQLSRYRGPDERKLTQDELLAYLCHAWNAWRRDETDRTRFQLTRMGKLTNENFPIPE